jgi:hypothetical protein
MTAAHLSYGHLFDRLMWAKDNLEPQQSKYRVVFEDPSEPDAPCKILVPDPNWLAAALHGSILPPVDTYLRDQSVPDGEPKEHPYAPPIGPMTEEEALEYLIMKDLPQRVWNDPTANAPHFAIVPVETIPSDRTHRMAWRLETLTRTAA